MNLRDLPLAHIYNFRDRSDDDCRRAMDEFAANGAKHLVFTEVLFERTMGNMKKLRTLQRNMEEAGLEFGDAHAPFGVDTDLNCPWENLRPMMIERHKLALRIVAEVGLKTITIHVGNAVHPDRVHPLDELHSYLLDGLEKLLPTAEECGVVIAIENIWSPVNTPEKLLDAIGRFNSPYLGLCYDSGHANLMRTCRRSNTEYNGPIQQSEHYGPIPFDDNVLEKMLPEVVNCHLHDNNGILDEHKLPGYGDVDWAHVTGLLARAPRLMCLQNEARPLSVRETCELFTTLLDDPDSITRRNYIATE